MSKSLSHGPAGSFVCYFLKSMTTARTTTRTPVDLSLKTAIITGGTSGLGYECAAQLLFNNLSHLIITARNKGKGSEAVKSLQSRFPSAKIEVWNLDMLDYESIRSFVEKCDQLDRIDIIILNAGIVAGKFKINEKTKHEECFSVNYLSTALLSILLLPVLKDKRPPGDEPARLTLIGSGLALAATFAEQKASSILSAFDDPVFFKSTERYNTTKLLLLFFVSSLSTLVDPTDVIVNVCDPGFVDTPGLDRDLSGFEQVMLGAFRWVVARSLRDGAWAYINAVVVKGARSHGGWVANWDVHPLPKIMYTPDGKVDGERLWEETLDEFEWAGVRGILASMERRSA
ncbi:uncharacterized protein BDV14DRAFT_188647 [Aspergillus stella-maris]|uniref:uncharacterized protein n=1 Tax=Aspergillus stella-maris TaxID=1810926 RepID=UPI003CCE1D42